MCVEPDAVMAEPIESIPEASPAERVVADVLPIGAPPAVAERVRDLVPLWFHTFALAPGIYTPGISRDHGYRLAVLGADRFAGRSVLDVGAFDGFYSFLAEAREARRVVAVDNEQYVAWVRTRFGLTLPGGAGFRAIAELLDSRVDYHRMDALHVRELGERFDVVLCFGILHRVSDPIALLQTLADVLTPSGEVVLETYGSRLPSAPRAIEVHRPSSSTAMTTASCPAHPSARSGLLTAKSPVKQPAIRRLTGGRRGDARRAATFHFASEDDKLRALKAIRVRGVHTGYEFMSELAGAPCGRACPVRRWRRHEDDFMTAGVRPGHTHPLGARVTGEGVNFSIWARTATGMDLLLFDQVDDPQPSRVLRLDPLEYRTFSYWHVFVPRLAWVTMRRPTSARASSGRASGSGSARPGPARRPCVRLCTGCSPSRGTGRLPAGCRRRWLRTTPGARVPRCSLSSRGPVVRCFAVNRSGGRHTLSGRGLRPQVRTRVAGGCATQTRPIVSS